MDIQQQLDELLANNPDLQQYVTKFWYVRDGETPPADVTHTLVLRSMTAGERHVTVGAVCTPKGMALLELFLALAATQPPA